MKSNFYSEGLKSTGDELYSLLKSKMSVVSRDISHQTAAEEYAENSQRL